MTLNPFSEVVGEMKNRPWSLMVMAALMVSVPYIAKNYATAGDLMVQQAAIAKIDHKLEALATDIRRSSLEQQVRDISTELFDLQQKINETIAARRPVDRLYYNRVVSLQNDKARLERQLTDLNQ